MLTIEYISTGRAYTDFEVESCANLIIDAHLEHLDQDMIYRVSTENLIDAIRVYIVENKINPEGWLQFKYGNEVMDVNEYGNPSHWARGFCDTSGNRLRRIVKGQLSIRREKTNKI
jgi:hypothetical protein